MKFPQAMLFGLALIVGVAIGYMFNPSVEEPAPAAKHEKAKGAIRDDGGDASIKALRARIAELEALLAKRAEKASEEEKASDDDRRGRRGERGFGGLSPKEWREKMKKENPEQYAQMTNGFARMRRDRQARAQRKADFLASIDTSKMSAAALKTHTELQELLAKSEELEQKMHQMHESDAEPSREEMGEIFKEMHETQQRIRELNAQERDNLMVETAKELGFDESDAVEVAEAFQEIMDNTSGGRGGHGPGPGGPGGAPGGGNFAPPPAP